MKFSKKQTLTVEITSWVSLFIIGLSVPKNILDYDWAESFVNAMGLVFPFVGKIALNPFFLYLAFYYALVCFAMVFFLVFYFFVEESALFNKEKTKKRIKTKNRTSLRAMGIFLVIMMLFSSAYIISSLGASGATGYTPKASLFLSRFGASTFGNIYISFLTTRVFWHCYFVFKYEKELIPDG